MKGCVFVTASDCLHGFTLAGFQQVVADRETVLEVVKQITRERPPGLMFIDERLLTESTLGRFQLLEKEWGGAIIMLPVPVETGEPITKDRGRQFISRVLGYQMKLS